MRRAEIVVGDVSGLPDHGVGSTSLGWWGSVGLMLVEGMALVLAIGAYYCLLPHENPWSQHQPPPSLPWGTVFTTIAIASELPNAWLKRRAKIHDLPAVRVGLSLMALVGVVLLGVRAIEFTALNAGWDQDAYGSIVWALLALHTLYVATATLDSGVLAARSFLTEFEGRKVSGVADSALYWHFIVCSGVVLYVVVYWTPRWM